MNKSNQKKKLRFCLKFYDLYVSIYGSLVLGPPTVLIKFELDVFKLILHFFFQLSLKKLNSDSKLSLSAHIHRDGSMHLAFTDKTSAELDQITLHSSS